METEAKAKVVASVGGVHNLFKFLAAVAVLTRSILEKRLNSSYWIELNTLKIESYQGPVHNKKLATGDMYKTGVKNGRIYMIKRSCTISFFERNVNGEYTFCIHVHG